MQPLFRKEEVGKCPAIQELQPPLLFGACLSTGPPSLSRSLNTYAKGFDYGKCICPLCRWA
jgi:hypothetical protein